MKKPSPAARANYFVTGPNARAIASSMGDAAALFGPFHAKAMGTSATVCGKPTLSWIKLWDLPFEAAPQPTCRECAEVVAHFAPQASP